MPGSPQHDRAGVVVDLAAVQRRRACRSTPSRAAGGRRGTASGTGSYGSTAAVCAPKSPPYQTLEQPQEHGHVAVERRGAEVLVHLMEAGQHLARSARARSRSSSTGRSPSPSSSGRRPSPRTGTCCSASMPNLATSSAFVETATKCLATAASSPPRPRSNHARAVLRVRHRLEGRERLRGHDEERLRGVEVARRLDEVGAVDVRHEAERPRPPLKARSASYAMTGPRSDPPIPMFTTLRIRRPCDPPRAVPHAPRRTRPSGRAPRARRRPRRGPAPRSAARAARAARRGARRAPP